MRESLKFPKLFPTSSIVCRMFLELYEFNIMFLNHFCLRKAHTKCSTANGDVQMRIEDSGWAYAGAINQISNTLTTKMWSSHNCCRLEGLSAIWVTQPWSHKQQDLHLKKWRENVHFFCSCVNAATEGDLNMHSSKGFYTTILVTEESHPVTAL